MQNHKVAAFRVVVCLLGALVAACADPGNSMQAASQVADKFFAAVKSQDFVKAASYFQDSPSDPRGKWLADLREYDGKYGQLANYKMVDSEVDTVYSGTRYILVYHAKYAKAGIQETLILFDGVSTFDGGTKSGLVIQGMVVKPLE